MMLAIVRRTFGGPEVLQLEERPMPQPGEGQVLIRVQAFGLNHAELYMRRGHWGEVAEVSGIECVGTVVEDTTGWLAPGQRVLAAMGGMGRSIDGSYAQFVCVRGANVVPVNSELSAEHLALLPESYGVAWSCLHTCLRLQPGEHLLVRGGSSALGRAAIDLARLHGAHVTATTRDPQRVDGLQSLGAHEVVVTDAVAMGGEYRAGYDAVLDLLGNSTLVDSLQMARPGGHVCLAGFLAGLAPLNQFNPLSDMPSTVQLSFFGSFNFGEAGHSMAEIPYQAIADAMLEGRLRGRPARVLSMQQVGHGHALMEREGGSGKLVVVTGH